MGKIWICLALTPLFSDRFASKGHILQFPTLEPNVTQWVGNYAVITAACLAIAMFNGSKQWHNGRINPMLCVAGAATFFTCSLVLNNLGCTIGMALCILLIAADLARRSHQPSIESSEPRHQHNLQRQTRLIGLAGLGAGFTLTLSNPKLLDALRIKHLLVRNDRLEFFAQGWHRFTAIQPSVDYIFSGPSSFQRPICFSASEVTFTSGNSCHSYWHNVIWDAFRNSGYTGLAISLLIVSTLVLGLIRSLKAKAIGPTAAFLGSFYVIFTSPIIETGAGEVLPLALLIAIGFTQLDALVQTQRPSASINA